MDLPGPVHSMVAAYLQAVDSAVPGALEGLYLVGSVALGDFRPHRSDVDFVAVSPRRLGAEQVQALARMHAELGAHRRPYFDGIYVTWSDLASDPAALGGCHAVHKGRLAPAGEGDIIAWHTLAPHGLARRGPNVDGLRIWNDVAALAAWTDRNLDEYWQRNMLDRSARLLTRGGAVGLGEWYCEWCVTGVSRLYYTLVTGDITSKAGAASYALATFPERWHRVIAEALRIRRDDRSRSLYRSRFSRRRDVLAFMRMAIADAHRSYREHHLGVSNTRHDG